MSDTTPAPSGENADVIIDTDTGVRFHPWTDGWAVGFRCEAPDGTTEYMYLNPSSDGGGDPEHRSNVFLYQGTHGKPDMDEAAAYYPVFENMAPSESPGKG